MRLIRFSLDACIVFKGHFLFKASSEYVLTLYEKDIINQTVTKMKELPSMQHHILKTDIELIT